MEQPREPIFYPNEMFYPSTTTSEKEKTLQSIDCTLKRIETILLDHQGKRNQPDVSGQESLL